MTKYIGYLSIVTACFVLLSGCIDMFGKANVTTNETVAKVNATDATAENASYSGDYIPGLNDSLRERNSRIYWASMFPITIRDYVVTPTGAYFIIENIADYKIEINSINAGGIVDTLFISNATSNMDYRDFVETGTFPINISSTKNAGPLTNASKRLTSGESTIFVATGITCSGTDTVYELGNVSFTYNVIGGISNNVMAGDRPIYGRCKTS